MQKKIVLIIIDGLGDRPLPGLGDKTPLESAKTPNLDNLAQKGTCGLVEVFKLPGDIPHSDTAHLALFGYDPNICYLGRGPYEAAGLGIELEKGDVTLRANFATVDKDLKVIDRRAGRIQDTAELIETISQIKIKGADILIKKSYGHRAVLILRGENLSSFITDGDPGKVEKKVNKVIPLPTCPPEETEKAEFTAKILNDFLEKSHSVLENHPLNEKRRKAGLFVANFILVRGAGRFEETPSFQEKYNLKACFVAGGALYKGIARILGMEEIPVEGATGFIKTNLKGKIQAIKDSLAKFDFVFCHIKATDSLSEDGDFIRKKEFIEKIDENLEPILDLKNTLIVVTADHSTCCILKRHCKDPVPLLIYGAGSDDVRQFSEKACKKGKLGKIKQLNLMAKIMELAGR